MLGTLAEIPDAALKKPLAIRRGSDGKKAFVIRTDAARLRLIGAMELGASHAVFALLEALGCRWFFETPEWEVVPSTPTLRVDLNRDDRTAILARRIWYGGGLFDHDRRADRCATTMPSRAAIAWRSRSPSIAATRGSRSSGRTRRSLISTRSISRWLAASVRASSFASAIQGCAGWRWLGSAFLKKHPQADMGSLETSDGGGQWECEECAKLGTISDRVFGLANEVGRAVAKDFPGKLVGLYAYNEHSEPPSFALEPNVYVQLTAGFTRGRYTFAELLELWPQQCRNLARGK